MAKTKRRKPRTFHLLRTKDISGVSGIGVVAEGVEFSNGYAVLTWLTEHTSVAVYHSVFVLQQVHTHFGDGLTQLIYDDESEPLYELGIDDPEYPENKSD